MTCFIAFLPYLPLSLSWPLTAFNHDSWRWGWGSLSTLSLLHLILSSSFPFCFISSNLLPHSFPVDTLFGSVFFDSQKIILCLSLLLAPLASPSSCPWWHPSNPSWFPKMQRILSIISWLVTLDFFEIMEQKEFLSKIQLPLFATSAKVWFFSATIILGAEVWKKQIKPTTKQTSKCISVLQILRRIWEDWNYMYSYMYLKISPCCIRSDCFFIVSCGRFKSF